MIGTLIATAASIAGEAIYNSVPAVSEAVDSVLWPIAGAITGKSQQDVAAALDVKYNTTKYGDKYQAQQVQDLARKAEEVAKTGKVDMVVKATPSTNSAINNAKPVQVLSKDYKVEASDAAKAKAAASGTLVTSMDMARERLATSNGIDYTASEYAKLQQQTDPGAEILDPGFYMPTDLLYGGDTTIRIYNPPTTTFEEYNYYTLSGKGNSQAMANDASVGSNIRLVNGTW